MNWTAKDKADLICSKALHVTTELGYFQHCIGVGTTEIYHFTVTT